MICKDCKTIIGFEEETDTTDCHVCRGVLCPVCTKEGDIWYCYKCDLVICDQCVTVVSSDAHDDDIDDASESYTVCPLCGREVMLFNDYL